MINKYNEVVKMIDDSYVPSWGEEQQQGTFANYQDKKEIVEMIANWLWCEFRGIHKDDEPYAYDKQLIKLCESGMVNIFATQYYNKRKYQIRNWIKGE